MPTALRAHWIPREHVVAVSNLNKNTVIEIGWPVLCVLWTLLWKSGNANYISTTYVLRYNFSIAGPSDDGPFWLPSRMLFKLHLWFDRPESWESWSWESWSWELVKSWSWSWELVLVGLGSWSWELVLGELDVIVIDRVIVIVIDIVMTSLVRHHKIILSQILHTFL